jgi:hypothetical protein
MRSIEKKVITIAAQNGRRTTPAKNPAKRLMISPHDFY